MTRLLGILFALPFLAAFTMPPWGTIPGKAHERQWQVYSALVERAVACGYDTSGIAAPRPATAVLFPSVYDHITLVDYKAKAREIIEAGYWVNRWAKNGGTYDTWFATNRGDFNRLWWTNAPAEYKSNLYEICAIPTNYFDVTPWAGLSGSSNGWPGFTNLLAELVETRIIAAPTLDTNWITDALEADAGYWKAEYNPTWTNGMDGKTVADLEGTWEQLYFITNYSAVWPFSFRRQENLDLGHLGVESFEGYSTNNSEEAYLNAESNALNVGSCGYRYTNYTWEAYCVGTVTNIGFIRYGCTTQDIGGGAFFYTAYVSNQCMFGDGFRGAIERAAVPVMSAAIATNYESERAFYYNASSNGAAAGCIGPAIYTNEALSVPLRERLFTRLFASNSYAPRQIDERWITDALPWPFADTTTNMSLYPTSCLVAVNWIATTNGFKWK